MSRRLVGATLVGTSLLIGTLPTSAATAPPELPRPTCANRINDLPGDANYPIATVAGSDVARPQGASVDALDITSMTLRTTSDRLYAYLRLKALPGTPGTYEAGHHYVMTFQDEEAGKTFYLRYMVANTAATMPDALAPKQTASYSDAKYSNQGSPAKLPLKTYEAVQDDANDYIILSVALEELKTLAYAGDMTPNLKLTKLTATTFAWLPAPPAADLGDSRRRADIAEAPDYTYVIGDDFCFGPPPAVLSALSAPSVQFGDRATLSATLKDEAGAALAGQPVTFTVAGGAPVNGTTNAAGVAKVSYPITQTAGSRAVTVAYAGDATNGKAKLVGAVSVRSEVAKIGKLAVAKPSATARTVTATLLDDDRHAIAGQKVNWYVNGKKVATLTTDGSGRTVFKAAKAGQTVQAKFSAVSGKYTAASSLAQKV